MLKAWTKWSIITMFTAFFCVLAEPGAFSQDGEVEAGQTASPFEFRGPTGKVSNSFSLFNRRIQGLPTYQERFDAEIQEDLSNGVWGARLMPWAWWRKPEAVGGDRASSKVYFEVKEGWVEHVASAWEARMGNQIFAWGAADQINPTDVWNPRDLYDPFQAPKLPLLSARMKIHPPELSDISLELIATPFFRESRLPLALPDQNSELPLADSRWLLPVPNSLSAGAFNSPLTYRVAPPTYSTTWQAGGRLSVTSLIEGWDFAASYFNGVESTPRFAVTRKGSTSSALLPVVVTLHPSFHRQEMAGVDGAGTLKVGGETFGARFEVAYFHRDNARAETAAADLRADLIKDDYIHGVLGSDYTFTKKIFDTVVYLNLQYVFYQRLEGAERSAGATVVEGLPVSVPWDNDFVLYFEDRIGSAFKATGNLIYSADHGDALASPGLQYNWTDNFKTSAGMDFFLGSRSGPRRGFFGQFQENQRMNFSASYVF